MLFLTKQQPKTDELLLSDEELQAQEEYQRHMKIQQVAGTVSTGAQLLAGITSCFILWVIILGNMPDYWPLWLQYSFTAAMTGGVVGIFELFPRALLPVSLDNLFYGHKDNIAIGFFTFSLVICLALQGLSMLTSYHSRTIISKSIVRKPPMVDASGYELEMERIKETKRAAYDKRIAELEENETQRMTEATQEGRNIYNRALNSKGSKMRKLWDSGKNDWVRLGPQLGAAAANARAEANSLLDRERNKIGKLKAERDSTIRAMEAISGAKSRQFRSDNQKMDAGYQAEVKKYSAWACWVGIGGSIVYVIMQIFLALHRQFCGLELKSKVFSPPFLYAVIQVFSLVMNSTSRGIYWLGQKQEMRPINMETMRVATKKGKSLPAPKGPEKLPNGGGYKITCKQCGKEAVKKSPKALYCSSECKDAYWAEQGVDVKQIKRAKRRVQTA